MTTNVGAQVRELTQAQETVATRTAVKTSRMTFMDNLRVFLTILVIALPPVNHLRGRCQLVLYRTAHHGIGRHPHDPFRRPMPVLLHGPVLPDLRILRPGRSGPERQREVYQRPADPPGDPAGAVQLCWSARSPNTSKQSHCLPNQPRELRSIYHRVLERQGLCSRPAVVRRSLAGLFPGLCPGPGYSELGKGPRSECPLQPTKKPLTNAWILAFILIVAALELHRAHLLPDRR